MRKQISPVIWWTDSFNSKCIWRKLRVFLYLVVHAGELNITFVFSVKQYPVSTVGSLGLQLASVQKIIIFESELSVIV